MAKVRAELHVYQFDIEGLGARQVEAFFADGLIREPADIFTLDPEVLLSFEGWGEISVNNLLAAIDGAKEQPLGRLLTAQQHQRHHAEAVQVRSERGKIRSHARQCRRRLLTIRRIK